VSPAEAGQVEIEQPDWRERFLEYFKRIEAPTVAQRLATPAQQRLLAEEWAFEQTMRDWRRFHWTPIEIKGEMKKMPALAVDAIIALAGLGVMPPRSINQNIPRGGELFEEQHNDHIWLTIASEAWAIQSIEDKMMHLWRGWEPEVERMSIDLTRAKWDKYADAAVAFLKAAYPE
jgi:hypothetical protein